MNQSSIIYTENEDLFIKIQNSMLKSLKSTQHLLDPQIVEDIRSKIQEIKNHDTMIQSIQYLIFSLINKIQLLSQRTTKHDINTEDYENLQISVQKAEAEIRKHIRLEQQLKLYMDGLEDRIEELQNQLKVEAQKYHQLFESTKAIDAEKKQLKKKLKSLQAKYKSHQSTSKEIRVISHKVSKNLLSEPSMGDYHSNPYYVPSTDKYKLIRHKKSSQKSSQMSKNKQLNYTSQKKLIENDIKVSLGQSPKKKRSMQEQPSHQTSTNNKADKTVYLKQSYKKNSRKLMKYSVQHPITKKQIRSSSVCH